MHGLCLLAHANNSKLMKIVVKSFDYMPVKLVVVVNTAAVCTCILDLRYLHAYLLMSDRPSTI